MNITTPNLIDDVRGLLTSGVSEVFRTMLALETKSGPVLDDWHAPGETLVAGSVGFIGDVNGVVYIQVTASFARTLAGRMLGLAEAELEGAYSRGGGPFGFFAVFPAREERSSSQTKKNRDTI